MIYSGAETLDLFQLQSGDVCKAAQTSSRWCLLDLLLLWSCQKSTNTKEEKETCKSSALLSLFILSTEYFLELAAVYFGSFGSSHVSSLHHSDFMFHPNTADGAEIGKTNHMLCLGSKRLRDERILHTPADEHSLSPSAEKSSCPLPVAQGGRGDLPQHHGEKRHAAGRQGAASVRQMPQTAARGGGGDGTSLILSRDDVVSP